ncbi:6-O-methylguanine DNA methyltransferase [Clostridiales bacterium S5-A14a]|nr:6-O-methylguanine DNA methyltransferase [Clostridiales bacterium S5-A14a]
MLYIHHYQSPLGGITMSSNGKALTGLWFDCQKQNSCSLKEEDLVDTTDHVLKETEKWLDTYFSGIAPNFMPPIFFDGTKFQETVWNLLLSIPYGEIITYGEIADKIAKVRGLDRMSAQAVGSAVSHNRIALIIPCHRVIGKNGNLTGYAAGIDKKIELLKLEGVDTIGMY